MQEPIFARSKFLGHQISWGPKGLGTISVMAISQTHFAFRSSEKLVFSDDSSDEDQTVKTLQNRFEQNRKGEAVFCRLLQKCFVLR